MAKNLILDPILAHLAEIWVPNFFFFFLSLTSTSSKALCHAIIQWNLKEK